MSSYDERLREQLTALPTPSHLAAQSEREVTKVVRQLAWMRQNIDLHSLCAAYEAAFGQDAIPPVWEALTGLRDKQPKAAEELAARAEMPAMNTLGKKWVLLLAVFALVDEFLKQSEHSGSGHAKGDKAILVDAGIPACAFATKLLNSSPDCVSESLDGKIYFAVSRVYTLADHLDDLCQLLLSSYRSSVLTHDGSATAAKQWLDKHVSDWETRNKLRVYQAVQLAKQERKFAEAAQLLIQGLATFTATELLTFEHYVKLTVLLSLVALDRPVLKTKVANSPEVLQVLAECPHLRRFFDAFIACDYKTFFALFQEVTEMVREDPLIGAHYRYYVRQIRLVAYRQYLKPYRSVTIAAMANAFGVSPAFIEREIVGFIPSGQLACSIDRIDGTIISKTEDVTADEYKAAMRASDDLTNQLLMLSRVIDL